MPTIKPSELESFIAPGRHPKQNMIGGIYIGRSLPFTPNTCKEENEWGNYITETIDQ